MVNHDAVPFRRWTSVKPAIVLPALILLGMTGICQAQKYAVTKLQTLPGGTYTSAVRMNNAGEVVGSADDSNGDTVAVAWVNAVPTIVFGINPLLGGYADADGINNHSVIVGYAFANWEPEVFEVGPGVSASQPFDHGIFVGAINDYNVMVGSIEGHPVIWSGVDISQKPNELPTVVDAALSTPAGINAAGEIVSTEDDWLPDLSGTYPVATRLKAGWNAPKALGGLGGLGSGANAVNANGWVVGWATLTSKLQHAVLWENNAGPFDLGTLGGKQSAANGINVEGDIAGEAQTTSGARHAVLWTHKHFVATDLNQEIIATVAEQITLTSAVDTNDRCMVLANGIDNKTGAQESFVLTLIDQSQCNVH